MKIYSKNHNKKSSKAKITAFEDHWTKGLNRRTFIKGSVAATLLASIAACKPSVEEFSTSDKVPEKELINQSSDIVELSNYTFSHKQQLDLQSVYMRLFPDDGDGPSANDLNDLEWAMTDEKNSKDGDPEFIIKGLGWLNQFSNDEHGKDFIALETVTQDMLIDATSKSEAGRRWLSMLIYYLIEALTLDPYYGGNTKGIGWQWLQYQGGFPNPVKGKTYRDFS